MKLNEIMKIQVREGSPAEKLQEKAKAVSPRLVIRRALIAKAIRKFNDEQQFAE